MGFRNKGDAEYDSDDFNPMNSPPVKRTTRSQDLGPVRDHRAVPSVSSALPSQANLPTAAGPEQLDLTGSDDHPESTSLVTGHQLSHPTQATTTTVGNNKLSIDAQKVPTGINTCFEAGDSSSKEMDTLAALTNDDPVLAVTPLSDDHEIKFLSRARLQFTSEKPPFVRLYRKSAPKMVMLANRDGELPEETTVATLITRMWDPKNCYYTLDVNGERLIVKPSGGICVHGKRGGNPYRTWSGQGTVFDPTPIAFSFNGRNEGMPSGRKDIEDDTESDFVYVSKDDSGSQSDDDYLSTTTEVLSLEPETQSSRIVHLGFPMTRGRLAQLAVDGNTGDMRHSNDAVGDEVESARSSSPPGQSNDAPEISAVAAGKRRASDTFEGDHSSKKARHVSAKPSVASIDTVRIPQTLTSYKQEHTILYVLVPGSTSDKVLIRLRSAMAVSTLFSSVCAAAGVAEDECRAIAFEFRGGDSGQDETIRVKRNMVETFELFLEVVDEASCWSEEGGRMVLQVQLR